MQHWEQAAWQPGWGGGQPDPTSSGPVCTDAQLHSQCSLGLRALMFHASGAICVCQPTIHTARLQIGHHLVMGTPGVEFSYFHLIFGRPLFSFPLGAILKLSALESQTARKTLRPIRIHIHFRLQSEYMQIGHRTVCSALFLSILRASAELLHKTKNSKT